MIVPEGAEYCARAAAHAPSADNTQPWPLRWDGEQLTLCALEPAPGALGFPPQHPAVQIALGAAAENLLQAAKAIEQAEPTLMPDAGLMDRIAAIRVPPTATAPRQDAALFLRHTNRFPYKRESVPDDVRAWLRAQAEGDARIIVLDQPKQILALGDLTRRASEVRFQTREIHEWLAASFRFTPEQVAQGDGLDIATLPLPPGGGYLLRFISEWRRMALLNRIGAYKAFAKLEEQPVAQAPLLVAILGRPGVIGARAAGRLMQRVWIELNQRGLAAQPGYVIPDQIQRLAQGQVPAPFTATITQVAGELNDILPLSEQTLHMILRVGYPTRDATRSRRLPLTQVLTSETK